MEGGTTIVEEGLLRLLEDEVTSTLLGSFEFFDLSLPLPSLLYPSPLTLHRTLRHLHSSTSTCSLANLRHLSLFLFDSA